MRGIVYGFLLFLLCAGPALAQTSTSTSTATSTMTGDINIGTGSTAGSGGNGGSSSINVPHQAPGFGVYASGPCSGVSFAVSTVLGGGGVGFTDAECSKREAARTFFMLGEKNIALHIARSLEAYQNIAGTLNPDKVDKKHPQVSSSDAAASEDVNSAEYNRTH